MSSSFSLAGSWIEFLKWYEQLLHGKWIEESMHKL